MYRNPSRRLVDFDWSQKHPLTCRPSCVFQMPAYAFKRKAWMGYNRKRYKRPFGAKNRAGGKTYGPRKNGTWAYKPFTTTAPPPSLRCNTRIVKSPDDIIPDRLFVPLRYMMIIGNTAVAGETFQIKLNSPYDCGATSDNTSAYGYTRLVTLFQRSRCWGSKIKVTVMPGISVSSYAPIVISVFPTNVYTAAPTIGGYQEGGEQPYAVTTSMEIVPSSNASTMSKVLQNQISTIKANSLTKTSFLGDANYTAVPNSDPTYVCYWDIRWDNSAAVGHSANEFKFLVQVEYLVEFFGRLNFDPALQHSDAPVFINEDTYFDMKDVKDELPLSMLAKAAEPQRGAEGPPRRESVPRGGSHLPPPVPAIIKKLPVKGMPVNSPAAFERTKDHKDPKEPQKKTEMAKAPFSTTTKV